LHIFHSHAIRKALVRLLPLTAISSRPDIKLGEMTAGRDQRIMRLKDQIALVTGGGKGIGRVIALRLAADGARVAVTGRHQADLDDTLALIQKEGGRGIAIAANVADEKKIGELFNSVRRQLGAIRMLVNNAGIAGPTASVGQMNRASWDEVLAINLTGPMLCCRAVLPDMLAQGGGKIINIGSVAGKRAYALRSPYAVSKWGLIGFTLTLAQEVGANNIQVNIVNPGPVEGERLRRVIEERAKELGQPAKGIENYYLEGTALKRFVAPEDVAATVAFLASSEADNITGQSIDVSAGHSL
jgi:NAD(P)-dependent dehydrogenase (short-subunit alcohol dehydrogenase family)